MADPSIFIIWGLVALCAVIAIRKGDGRFKRGLQRGLEMFMVNGPRVLAALLAAGFLAYLLPKELVAAWLGDEAGWKGILIGCAVGPFFPGGPLVIFPVIVALLKAGAGVPAVIAFLTSASVWGVHRIIMFEIPMMGTRFTAIRMISSIFMPPVAGLLAALIVQFAGAPAGVR